MKNFKKRFHKKALPSPTLLWEAYFEQWSAQSPTPQAPFQEFWLDYENLLVRSKKTRRKHSIQVTDASQKLRSIYDQFWKTRNPNISLESAQEFKNTGAGWRPVVIIASMITLGFIFVNLGFESIVLPLGGLAMLIFLYKIGGNGSNKNLKQAIDDHRLVNYWLDMEPTHLEYEQLDNFDNHTQFVLPYHKIQALEQTKEGLVIKFYNPRTWWGKIVGLFSKKRTIPAFIPEYETICDFLQEVLTHNQQHRQLVKQLQDTYRS